jgi:hypothetical protein
LLDESRDIDTSLLNPGGRSANEVVNRPIAGRGAILAKHKVLETTSDDRSVGVRLDHTSSGQLGIFPDRERDDDQIIEHGGAAVLLIGREIAPAVEDTTIDCEESGLDPRCVIKRG